MSKITIEMNTERLALLYRISQSLNSTLELDEVLVRLIDSVIEIMKAERGFLMLINELGELEFKAARGIEQRIVADPEFKISRSIVEEVAKTGEAVLTSDASEEFSTRASVISLNLRSILCVPLQVRDRMLGVVYVDNRFATNVFSPDDLELLKVVASNAAVAVENARLYQVAIEKGRMEQEIAVAQQVQTSLIPEEEPEIEGWEIAGYWKPARMVSGDFYDFIQREEDKLGIVVADVVDKGVAAAFFMAYSRSVLRASLMNTTRSAALCICDMNRVIYADAAYGMFVTLAYLEIEPDGDVLTYVNAGHNPPYLIQPGKGTIEPLTRTGKLIGVLDDIDYDEETRQMEVGDMVVAYTDGITEAANGELEEFGDKRLLAILEKVDKGTSASKMLHMILDAVDDFVGEDKQSDDITLVVVKKV